MSASATQGGHKYFFSITLGIAIHLFLSIAYVFAVLFGPYFAALNSSTFFWTDSHTITHFCDDVIGTVVQW